MKIVYLHGFGSTGNSPKAYKLKAEFGEDNVISPDLPIDPEAVIELINGIISDLDDNVLFVGTSLGGFYAHYFASHYNKQCVLINPSIHPSESLKKRLGINRNYSTKEKFELTENHLDSFHDMEVEKDGYFANIFIAKDDDVIDPYQSIDYFESRGSYIIATDDGGHRYDLHWDKVIDFIKILSK